MCIQQTEGPRKSGVTLESQVTPLLFESMLARALKVYSTPAIALWIASISAPRSLPSEAAFLYGLADSR